MHIKKIIINKLEKKKRNKLKPTKSGNLRVKERSEIEDIWAIFYFLRYM